MMRQHEDLAMIGRLLTPPAFPAIVRPWPAHRAEHVAAQNPGADVRKAARGEIIVRAGRAVVLAEKPLLQCPRRKHPFMQRHAADTERVVDTLIGPRAIAIGRDGKTADYELRRHEWLPGIDDAAPAQGRMARARSDSPRLFFSATADQPKYRSNIPR